jgi:hypothetical protein
MEVDCPQNQRPLSADEVEQRTELLRRHAPTRYFEIFPEWVVERAVLISEHRGPACPLLWGNPIRREQFIRTVCGLANNGTALARKAIASDIAYQWF